MRRITTMMFLAALFVGCSGGQDEVLENDPKVTEQKTQEYQKQMEEAMKNNKGMPGKR